MSAASVQEMEAEVERLREALGDMLDTIGECIEDAVSREDMPEFFKVIDQARDVLATEVRFVAAATLSDGLSPEERADLIKLGARAAYAELHAQAGRKSSLPEDFDKLQSATRERCEIVALRVLQACKVLP